MASGKKVAEMTDAEFDAFVEKTMSKGGSKTSAYSAPKKPKSKPKYEATTSGAAKAIRDRKNVIDEAVGYKDGGAVYAKPRCKRKKHKYCK